MAGGAPQYSAWPAACSATALRGSSTSTDRAVVPRDGGRPSIVRTVPPVRTQAMTRSEAVFSTTSSTSPALAAGNSVAARSAPPPLITTQRCRKCCLKKSSFDSGCSSASRVSGSSRGGALLRRVSQGAAMLDEEGVLLCHLCESVCCAVVCGARALNFLCAANDAIYASLTA